ncbi:MAG: hypothetical protein ACKVPY_06355 [Paracoccaceae bacterium]
MRAVSIFVVLLSMAAGLLAAGLALTDRAEAQSCSDCPVTSLPSGPPNPPWGPGPATITTPNTDSIATSIAGITDTCGRVDPRYRIDCLRRAYIEAARDIPDTGDYRPVRQALLDAAAKLDGIVTANLDPALEPLRPREFGKPLAKRLPPVRAVAGDRLTEASRAAEAVIAETGLLILRSGDRPPRRTSHYQTIAAAVDTNLILLRSG